MALIEKLNAIGNAIRSKTGKEEKLTLEQMVTEIEGIEVGGSGENNDTARQLIEGTLTSLSDKDITNIKIRVFGYNNTLKEVDLPNAKTIGMAAFASATALETVKLDRIETLITSAQDQQFYNCSSLKNVSMTSLKAVGNASFDGCTSLKQVYFPSLTRVGGNGFANSGLETARFPALASIGGNAFRQSKLTALILEGSTMVTLDNANAFTGTPIANGTGYIYVPQSIIDEYKVATNWVTYSNQFRAIEDYPEICGGAE
jgi:hypothetical protein